MNETTTQSLRAKGLSNLVLLLLFLPASLIAQPICDAHFQHYSAANPDSMRFYAAIGNTTGYHYLWSFGDGTSSTVLNPWHYYSHGGSFVVCLTVWDSSALGSCSATWCDSIHIPPPTPPICDAHFQHYSGANPDSVHFYPATSNNTAFHYYWSFGDGSTSTSHDPWHYYPHGGNFLVCLTVSDSTSTGICTATWCDSIHLAPPPPICNAHFQHYSAVNPDSMRFYAGTSGTTGYHYYWSFGDGSTSTLPYPWHYYPHGGNFLVCLTVSDSTPAGTCTATWCDSIHIPPPTTPICDAHFQHYSVANPDSVHFYPAAGNNTAFHYYWSFGDGSTSTSHDPWHYYPHGGNFLVCLTVSDSTPTGTCTATWCDSIHLAPPPAPLCNAHFQHYSAANPDSVHFYPAAGNNTAFHYYWSFGDGSTSTLPSPWHYYPHGGNFLVCLTVTGSTSTGSCTATWCDSIHIQPPPPPLCDAHFQHYSAANPDSVHFYPAAGNNTAFHYYWSFGDGSTSTSHDPWHYYPHGGNFLVCLTVSDSTSTGICTATWCDSIHLAPPPPICNAHFQHYSAVNPDSVRFYAGTSGTTGYHYYWSFGDGSTSTLPYPWHYYPHGGNFLVCLTVSDSTPAGSCTATWCDSIHMAPPPPPLCDAHFQHYSVANPDSMHFYPAAGNNTAFHYYWSFGDGSTSTSHDPWHYYPHGGNFLVCLTVSDSTSTGTCTATWCDSIHLAPPPPLCNAHFQHYSAVNPDSVRFYAGTSGTTGYHYYWSFGDGSTSTLPYPWHYYPHGGNFLVCLTVSDSTPTGTCTATWCDSIHLAPPPICDAHFQHYSGANPDSVHFYPAAGNNTAFHYYWSFGDGSTSTSHDPWHYYPHGGNFLVCLTVTGSTSTGSCTATWCDSIHIQPPPPPLCDAHFQHYSAANPDSVRFYAAIGNTTGYHYLWSFGDGTSSTVLNPWHYYSHGGSYVVCLTVWDSSALGSCSATWCDSIHIPPPTTPICDAHFQHYSGANPDSVHFYPATSNNTAFHYYWSFGDGSTSTSHDPWHYYPHGGNFLVCLTVSDSTSTGICTATWCDSIHLAPPPPPLCNAHFQHYSGANPDSIRFYAGTSGTTAGYHYFWSFGDGTASTLPYPWHYYPHGGNFLVCLTVSNSTPTGTCTATWCDSIHLAPPPPPLCNAHFQHYSAANPESVHFYPAASNNTSFHYYWSFGDGSTSTSHDPWHYYPHGGNFLVCLTVSDSTSTGICTATWCDSIHIPSLIPTPCIAQFLHYTGANPDSIHFYPLAGSIAGMHYYWNFNDGTSSTARDPWHYFAGSGNHIVCLTIIDTLPGSGCIVTWCDNVFTPVHIHVFINPNPIRELANIDIADAVTPVSFRIYDVTGVLIYRKDNLSNGSFSLNRAGIRSGIYYYQLVDESRVVAKGKIVVID